MTYFNGFLATGCQFNAQALLANIVLEGAPALGLPLGLNDLIRSTAAIHGAEVADTIGLLGPSDIQPDCVHTSDTGYEIIASQFIDAFENENDDDDFD